MWNWQSQLFGGGSGTGGRVSRTHSGNVSLPWITFGSLFGILSVVAQEAFMLGGRGATCQRGPSKGLDAGSADPLHQWTDRPEVNHGLRRTSEEKQMGCRSSSWTTCAFLCAFAFGMLPARAADQQLIDAAKKEGE